METRRCRLMGTTRDRQNQNGTDRRIRGTTVIDPASGWFEPGALENGPADLKAQSLFCSTRLAYYPQPQETVFDDERKKAGSPDL